MYFIIITHNITGINFILLYTLYIINNKSEKHLKLLIKIRKFTVLKAYFREISLSSFPIQFFM